MSAGSTARVVAALAAGSLLKTRTKSAIVGFLMLFGALLTITGTALLDSVEASMQRSIVSSVAGHLQVYSGEAKDPLRLFGTMMAVDDYGVIPDFTAMQQALAGVGNIRAVVPMGIEMALVTGGNDFDLALDDLRAAVRDRPELVADQIAYVRHMLELLAGEMEKATALARDREKLARELALIRETASDTFWSGFAADPETALTRLESEIAPLKNDGFMWYLRLLGTDPQQFAREFDRLMIVDGQMIPEGQPGILVSKYVYEHYIKNKAARELDRLHEEVVGKGRTIEGDPELTAKVRQLAGLSGFITFQLHPEQAREVESRLRQMLPGVAGGLSELASAFLTVDDGNLVERHAAFYRDIAPLIRLYLFRVGETLTLRCYTKAGYLRARTVTLWGTYSFRGMEESHIAGEFTLTDMRTFRELYGQMSAGQVAELSGIRAEAGIAAVGRDAAEDALFGGGQAVEAATADAGGFDEFAGGGPVRAAGGQQPESGPDEGLVLNAAVVLNDPERIGETQAEIRAAFERAGLNLTVIDWQEVAGIVGQFVMLFRGVLYVAIGIIFLVALVIINNSMIMATMERVAEIGTMRAIGATGRFVLALFLMETTILGLVAGLLGSLAAFGLVSLLGAVGIPASGEAMTFLFSGPRLYPTLSLQNIGAGLGLILLVSLISTFYPALVATRIRPALAMQTKE